MKKIGIIGLSEGNGHPYSFSSIINGYNSCHLKQSGWDVIYEYVTKRDISEFGFGSTKITHVWTQSKEISNSLKLSCNIQHIVENYEDMIDEVDGIILARDDYEHHLVMAKPFLESNKKVFIDKPLTVDIEELKYYKKYIFNGQLMSMSGMRYAMELDDLRCNIGKFGQIKFIQSTVINDWEKYGIHIIDAVLGFLPYFPISIEYIPNGIGTYTIEFENGITWNINVLGNSIKTFSINIWGEYNKAYFELVDNFSMFRRMLWRFVQLVEKDELHYSPKDLIIALCLLIAGNISKKENRKVYLDEFSHVYNN